jgi:hypothetical protein
MLHLLYERLICSLTLRGAHRLTALENKELRKIYEHMNDEITEN